MVKFWKDPTKQVNSFLNYLNGKDQKIEKNVLELVDRIEAKDLAELFGWDCDDQTLAEIDRMKKVLLSHAPT